MSSAPNPAGSAVPTDRIFEAFLRRQLAEGTALAADSDLLGLTPVDGNPPRKYIAEFTCRGLVRTGRGPVREASRFAVGIWFPPDYLRRANGFEVLTWLGPPNVYHPNIHPGAHRICVGRITPGTPLVDLLYQCFEIVAFHKVTMREDDALNHDACAWARRNLDLFPVDRRPLLRPGARRPAAPVKETTP